MTEVKTDRKSWSEDSSYRQITPEMIEAERWRVGKELSWVQPHVDTATKDAIRHWAYGIGDRNPVFTDEDYAAGTRYGGIIAPPSMVMCLDRNILGSSMRGFPGVHSWQLGNSFEWHAPIRRDTVVAAKTIMEDMQEVESAYAGGVAVDQTIRADMTDRDTGELLCVARNFIRRFSRNAAAQTQKYGSRREPSVYSDDDLVRIGEMYRNEEVRGSKTRYVQDVAVGESLPALVRGPLTLSDCLWHFDNMGLYELVRRRCRTIVICDGEQDLHLQFDGLGQSTRKIRLDFGVEIDLKDIRHMRSDDTSPGHVVIGSITYPEDPVHPGTIIYIKTSLDGDEPVDIVNYKREDPSFPQDTTLNQFFTESKFESYRALGSHIATHPTIVARLKQYLDK